MFDRKMRSTALSSYRTWPIVEKIMPYSEKFPTPIADMLTNAEKANPKAVKMFTLTHDILKQYAIETGLNKIMTDT